MRDETEPILESEDGRTLRLVRGTGRLARRLWPFAATLAVVALGFWLYGALFPPPPPLTDADVDQRVVQALASATPPPAYSAQVYQVILPSLVLIRTRGTNANGDDGAGVGSGVVINAQGNILTALHVVSGAAEIELYFADGSQARAQIAVAVPEDDIAVLQPDQPPELIVPAVLGNPNAMRVGDQAFVLGNPLGFAGSLSAGVISGFDRTLPLGENGEQLEGLIQFDAAVNPGNSGGPLLNRQGQVIGIVTALANATAQNSFTGIGFAVPIDTAGGAAGAPPY
jgi:S1-C subfamily serine protease